MCFNFNDNPNPAGGAQSDETITATNSQLFRQFLERMVVLSDLMAAKLIQIEEARKVAEKQQKLLDSQDFFFYSFWSGIDTNTVSEFIKETRAWRLVNPDKKRIIMCLNTPGGYVIDGNALKDYCDYLIDKGYEITVFVMGEAASDGSYILQCASPGRRIIAPTARILIHEAMWDYQGPVTKQEDTLKLNKELWNDFVAVLAERSPRYRGKARNLKRWVSGHDRWMKLKKQ